MEDDIIELKPMDAPKASPKGKTLITIGTGPVPLDPVQLPVAVGLPSPSATARPERDCIVVLGRRQSGKTIFLATIYARLWKSLDGLTAKSLTGEVHKQLMSVHQMLKEGQWPPSTLGTSQISLEIEYHKKR